MNIERRGSMAGWFVLSFFIAMIAFSCKKDGPTRAVITVRSATQAPVQGATVTLWQDTVYNPTTGVKSDLRVSKVSDASGRAEFDFELEAFLNVLAVKGVDSGKSFIRLKEHETVEQTVNL